MSKNETVLIVGGSGIVGSHLCIALRGHFKVFATYYQKPTQIPGVTMIHAAIENKLWIKKVLQSLNPDVIIYLLGDHLQEWGYLKEAALEKLINQGPSVLGNSLQGGSPKVIFLSNSYVFEGSRGNYRENDIVLPRTDLGRLKFSGENTIRGTCLNYMILRSAPLLGRGNGYHLSFLDHLRMALNRQQAITISSSEFHNFATIPSFCDFVRRVILSGLKNRILHFGGLSKLTHFEVATRFAKRFGYDPSLIFPSYRPQKKQMEFKSESKKLLESLYTLPDFSLNSTLATETLKIKPLVVDESFDLLERHMLSA